MKRHIIGIDPGVKTGYAIFDTIEKRIVLIETTDFWGCIGNLRTMIEMSGDAHVIIEDPNGNIPVFDKSGVKNANMKLRVAQNVGSNKREASLLIEFMEREHIEHTIIVPKRSKLDAKSFKNLTKWEGVTNQHERDAAMLCFGVYK